ncbi:MAG: hypothetical protein HY934_01410, partial [Candidatus Firestonebacteria bacterium]|nr:hypothetical protein [Candidatus Firestonebacteria bacterium]
MFHQKLKIYIKISILFVCLFLETCAGKNNLKQHIPLKVEGNIYKNTVWSGDIIITGDVVILKDVKLTILPGTMINIEKSPRDRVDPQYFSGNIELIVRGKLRALGKKKKHIVFSSYPENNENSNWAGIIFENSNENNILEYCDIFDADTGVNIINSLVTIENCRFERNIYAITVLSSYK